MEVFLQEVSSNAMNWWEDNDDPGRVGPRPPDHLPRSGDVPRSVEMSKNLVESDLPRWEWLYHKLIDQESREILLKVLAYRALGYRRVKLPLNTPAYWDGLKRLERLADPGDTIPIDYEGWHLPLMDLNSIGTPLKVYCSPKACYGAIVLGQYRCGDIAVAPGDYVIDGGSCWGETVLDFALRAGHSGRVFSFEFLPQNLHVLRRNLELNPALGTRIEVIEKALWNESGQELDYDANGPATRVRHDARTQGNQTSTLSIDDLVADRGLPRLDFVKLDIEGAELRALHGAAQTMRRFKPKLAVCVYHNLRDFFEIPEYLDSLSVGYRFFLRHHTIHGSETVLYAAATTRR
jgi:FkbM family methyltransferase